ncbi:ribonuclease H-like domain-containing protein [Tanacetum coccineum]
MELLKRAHMLNCNPTQNPADTKSKLGPEGTLISDPTLYRSLAGDLWYLTFTRPDLSYIVQQIFLYMHDPREPHLAALKRIIRYVQGTLEFGNNLISWSSKRQHTLLCSSAEAEYRGISNDVAETAWLRNLLRELHTPLVTATLVYCDNGHVHLFHVLSRYRYADIFTKGLLLALFEEFRTSLSVRLPPSQTAEEC